MKKSPFSMQRGNGNNRPGFGWNSGNSPGRGYGRPANFDFYSPNRSLNSGQTSDDNFIPFNNTTPPLNDRKSSGNWSSPNGGNWHSPGGRGNYRKSWSPAFSTPGNNSASNSPRQSPYYKNGGNPFRGYAKSFHRGNTQRNVDISSYVNLKSFLEDPWAELLKKLTKEDNLNSSTAESSFTRSFNSSVQDESLLDDSSEEANLTGSQDIKNSLPTSQESINEICESSLDPKMSQDSKD